MARKFIDSKATIGKPKSAPIGEVEIKANSSSRSLGSIPVAEPKRIRLEIKNNNYLHMDTSAIIGDKIKVSKLYAIRMAKWILSQYDRQL